MSKHEVEAALSRMCGSTRLMAELIYGTGMRIKECMSLQVKDIEFDLRSIMVRAAKGNEDMERISGRSRYYLVIRVLKPR